MTVRHSARLPGRLLYNAAYIAVIFTSCAAAAWLPWDDIALGVPA